MKKVLLGSILVWHSLKKLLPMTEKNEQKKERSKWTRLKLFNWGIIISQKLLMVSILFFLNICKFHDLIYNKIYNLICLSYWLEICTLIIMHKDLKILFHIYSFNIFILYLALLFVFCTIFRSTCTFQLLAQNMQHLNNLSIHSFCLHNMFISSDKARHIM